MTPECPHLGFVLEPILGHLTHAQNLQELVPRMEDVDPSFFLVPFATEGVAARLPVYRSNWTVRAGVRASAGIRAMDRRRRLDALFVHTQVPAVLAQHWLRRVPTIVSLDATPMQYDSLGDHYDHQVGDPRLERLKWRLNARCFHRAHHVVCWSQWAKDGLVRDYGVDPEKVTVLAPGVRLERWRRQGPPPSTDDGVVRILFVGGDFERKGGPTLLEAFRRLRLLTPAGRPAPELHLVTGSTVDAEPGVVVHHGIRPNTDELRALYQSADIFCLPTLGDCLPMVLAEAGAMGLPLVSTDVAAIGEVVQDDRTGYLVPPRAPDALTARLATLAGDADLRRRLGDAAAHVVAEHHDAARNAGQVVQLMLAAQRDRSRMGASTAPRNPVLLTVSGVIDAALPSKVADGERPRVDYLEMAAAFPADLLDVGMARASSGAVGRAIELVAGQHVLLGWAAFRRGRHYDVVFSDGEQVGLPYAALCRLFGRGRARHLMIVHVMSVRMKIRLFRALRMVDLIDQYVAYASAQHDVLVSSLGVDPARVALMPFMVDTSFFSPLAVDPSPRHMICTAGLERRDYATLMEAIDGLDEVEVVVAAASPWSRQADWNGGQALPANVEVCRLDLAQLRQLYADARLVVLPLVDTDFQAGVTTLLEAMAMAKPVVCTRTRGQTDLIEDGVNGVYVPPSDADALRAAVERLLGDPETAELLGKRARLDVVERADIDVYVDRLAGLVRSVGSRQK